MVLPENRLFCRLDGLDQVVREQRRQDALQSLRLMEADSVPVFEEVVQTAAHFTQTPVAWLSFVDGQREFLKATFGLSRLGLMNDLILQRSIDLQDAFGVHVVDSHQPLILHNTSNHPAFSQSLLAQQYGIQSYLGVPLMTSQGQYLGVLSVLDMVPREFTIEQIEWLMLTARMGMSDYERSVYQRQVQDLQSSLEQSRQPAHPPVSNPSAIAPSQAQNAIKQTPIPLKFELLAQLTQELRTPLTSVMGMASVLTREIYGPLTLKQREYLDIIHHSGEYLLSLVKEILELSHLDLAQQQLVPASVDIEMLCQQAIATLDQAAARREQKIRLTVEPGQRIWVLDKEKIRQMLYHLIFSVIQSSNGGSTVHLHVSNKIGSLRLSIWVTHPCLEDALMMTPDFSMSDSRIIAGSDFLSRSGSSASATLTAPTSPEVGIHKALQNNLGFRLTQQLVTLHGGQIQIQGEGGSGYRYIITLPRLSQTAAQ